MSKTDKSKKEFDELFSDWEKEIQKPEVQVSSNPADYADNEPYRKIIGLGKDVLPFVLEKIESGVFFMNQAALEIMNADLDEMIEREAHEPADRQFHFMGKNRPKFLSEQQKSAIILKAAGRKL